MITFAKYKSSAIENGKRILKVLQFGVKTAKESSPFGFDSQAPEGYTAIYAESASKEEAVVVGYINKEQLAEVGESRMYALGSNGELGGFVYCKGDGTVGLNGFDHSSVRFGPLVEALQAQNVLINAELAKISAAVAAGNVLINAELVKINNTINNENILINAELVKIAASITSLGGTYLVTPVNGSYTPTPVTTDITAAEAETVKIK